MRIVVTRDADEKRVTTVDGKRLGEQGRVSWLMSLDKPPELFLSWDGENVWRVAEGEVWVDGVLVVRVGDKERLLRTVVA